MKHPGFPRKATDILSRRPNTTGPHRMTAARFPDIFTALPERVLRRCNKTKKPASSS
jgi:hypothetical protein